MPARVSPGGASHRKRSKWHQLRPSRYRLTPPSSYQLWWFAVIDSGYEKAVDLLDILRRQAGRFQCPKCGESLADCQLEMVAHADEQSLVKVTCAHCQDTRMIAVAVAAETEPAAPVIEVRDQPIDELGRPITTDDVLDARLALAAFDGDLASLLR